MVRRKDFINSKGRTKVSGFVGKKFVPNHGAKFPDGSTMLPKLITVHRVFADENNGEIKVEFKDPYKEMHVRPIGYLANFQQVGM